MAVIDSGLITEKSIQKGKYVAGRDIIISEERNLTIHKTKFVNTNLEPYREGRYVVPTFRDKVLNKLKEEKLVLIGGGIEFDKNAFTRHLASRVLENSKNREVKEWAYQSDKSSLFDSILEEEKPCVFILTQITPDVINYNLTRLFDFYV